MEPACPLSSHSSGTPTLTSATLDTLIGLSQKSRGKGKEKSGSNRGSAFPSALAFSTQAKPSWTERGSILLMESLQFPWLLDAALECLRNTKKRLNFQRDLYIVLNWRLSCSTNREIFANLLFNFSPLKGSMLCEERTHLITELPFYNPKILFNQDSTWRQNSKCLAVKSFGISFKFESYSLTYYL